MSFLLSEDSSLKKAVFRTVRRGKSEEVNSNYKSLRGTLSWLLMLYKEKLAVSTGTNQAAIPSIKDLSGHLPTEIKVPLRSRSKGKKPTF